MLIKDNCHREFANHRTKALQAQAPDSSSTATCSEPCLPCAFRLRRSNSATATGLKLGLGLFGGFGLEAVAAETSGFVRGTAGTAPPLSFPKAPRATPRRCSRRPL